MAPPRRPVVVAGIALVCAVSAVVVGSRVVGGADPSPPAAVTAAPSTTRAASAPTSTAVPSAAVPAVALRWESHDTGSPARLRALAAVSASVAWAAGQGGAVFLTTDGGGTWRSVPPPGASGVEFRDLVAFSGRRALVLATGPRSRAYATDDGGTTWTSADLDEDGAAFYDCLTLAADGHGTAVSDPVRGAFRFVETADGGHTWVVVDPSGTPASRPNEFAVAADGGCLSTGPDGTLYLASAGADGSRVYVSRTAGRTWAVADVPLAEAPSAGATAVAFQDPAHGIVVGGDLAAPDSALGTAAWSADDGASWRPADVPPVGYRSGLAWLPGRPATAVTVGPGGSDVTVDAGRTWSRFDDTSFDAVDCAADGACWAAGEGGRVARLDVRPSS